MTYQRKHKTHFRLSKVNHDGGAITSRLYPLYTSRNKFLSNSALLRSFEKSHHRPIVTIQAMSLSVTVQMSISDISSDARFVQNAKHVCFSHIPNNVCLITTQIMTVSVTVQTMF